METYSSPRGRNLAMPIPRLTHPALLRHDSALEGGGFELPVPRGTPAFLPKTKFAADSALEGDGFEPPVPGTKEPVFVAEGELRDRTGAAKKGCFLCGTDGSNPSPSREESANHRFLSSRQAITCAGTYHGELGESMIVLSMEQS